MRYGGSAVYPEPFRCPKLTEVNDNERQTAEEAVKGIQPPLYVLLEHWCHLAYKPVERPICRCRNRDSLDSDLERHNLGGTDEGR